MLSNKTLFLSCFVVAPILAKIPNSLVFSVKEILKLFLITNIDVNIIIAITILAKNIIYSFVLLLLKTPKNCSKESLVITSELLNIKCFFNSVCTS